MARRGAFVVLILVGLLGCGWVAMAQERVMVEERTGEVLRVVGRTVVIRNDLGEVRQYTELPDDVRLYVGGELVPIEDLQEGMKLHAVRWENVPAPVVVTPRMEVADARGRPVRVAAYRHSDPRLDSAMRFLAETAIEDSHRIAKPTYRVDVPKSCTLRFDRLDAGGLRVPVHVVDLADLDPEHSGRRENRICLETTSLENRIAVHALSVDPDRTYRYNDRPIPGSEASRDRFCFYVSYWNSDRVSRALSFALNACGAESDW
ncbi:MAG: hypothetical protein GY719_22325 [bacterium]|nr:hypothetical protein [bacterium]